MKETESSSPEERVAKVDGILKQVIQRLSALEVGLNHVETEISQLRRDMHSQFRWTIGITLGILIPCG